MARIARNPQKGASPRNNRRDDENKRKKDDGKTRRRQPVRERKDSEGRMPSKMTAGNVGFFDENGKREKTRDAKHDEDWLSGLRDYVDITYLDPAPITDDGAGLPSRLVVSCGIFIYPQREGRSTDLVDDPAYAKRLAMYVDGLRRVVEITKDYLPGYHVRLYVDASVQEKSPASFATIEQVHKTFPRHLERVHVRATGILHDLREHACPGNTTFLPSIWRYLALFDAERPCDVVHLCDLETAPFVPFTPDGRRWEAEKERALISSFTGSYLPTYCGVGIVLTRHEVEACASASAASIQRTPRTPSVSLVPLEAWHRMMHIVIDAHFREFLKRIYDDDARLLRQLAASPEYGQLVQDVMTGAKSCDDPELLAPLRTRVPFPSPEHEDALRKSTQYVRLLMLPVCDGTSRVPADFRTSFRNTKIMDDPGLILHFEYGVDELLFHGLFEWFGKNDVHIMTDEQGSKTYLSRMKEMETVAMVKKIANGVMSFVKLLRMDEILYMDYEVAFAELWVRIMVFSLKDTVAASRMADAHYTWYCAALQQMGIDRRGFLALTEKLARLGNFAKIAAKRLFVTKPIHAEDWIRAWNVLFTRFQSKWMLGWIRHPEINPMHSTGIV